MLYSLLAVSLGAKAPNACFGSLSFAGLVVLARSLNPIPSRTRPLNSSAPMVLWLKPWESRSLPGLPRTKQFLFRRHQSANAAFPQERGVFVFEHKIDTAIRRSRDVISTRRIFACAAYSLVSGKQGKSAGPNRARRTVLDIQFMIGSFQTTYAVST